MPLSDYSTLRALDAARLLPVNELGAPEAALARSGEAPMCGLFLHEGVGDLHVHTLVPVPSGTLLGQLAASVRLDVPQAAPQTLDACMAAWATFRVPVAMSPSSSQTVVESSAILTPAQVALMPVREPTLCARLADGTQGSRLLTFPCTEHCALCRTERRYGDSLQLVAHLREHATAVSDTSGGALLCPWPGCRHVCKDDTLLQRHVLETHAGLFFHCSTCDFEFSPLQPMDQIKAHCKECAKTYYDKLARRVDDGDTDTAAAAATTAAGRVQHTLCFETGDKSNLFAFMGSSELEAVDANVHVILCWVDQRPVLCVESLADLPQGTELFYNWGESLSHMLRTLLWAAASQSHSMYIYRTLLENLIDTYSLERPPLEPLLPVDAFPDLLWLRHLRHDSLMPWNHEPLVRQFATRPLDECMPRVSSELAFAVGRCKPLEHTTSTLRTRELVAHIPLAHRPPRWQDEFSRHLKEAHTLMYTSECPRIELRRVLFLHHPVRFLNPPDRDQFAVYACSRFSQGEPIVCYKGCVVTQQEYESLETPQYSFDFGLEYGLHIDADRQGSEGRFVNDCFGRNWEPGRTDRAAANARYVACWDDTYNIPVLFIVSGVADPSGGGRCFVNSGEEVIVEYGTDFWNPLMHELTRRHCTSYCESMQISAQLTKFLSAKGFPIPPMPSWARLSTLSHGLFHHALPDHALRGSIPDVGADFECDIEAIVSKRCTAFGVQYLVKWVGFDSSHNSWEHAENLPEEMVREYDMQNTSSSRRRRKP